MRSRRLASSARRVGAHPRTRSVTAHLREISARARARARMRTRQRRALSGGREHANRRRAVSSAPLRQRGWPACAMSVSDSPLRRRCVSRPPPPALGWRARALLAPHAQTTIMAVAYDGGVVLGADSPIDGQLRGEQGDDKIVPLTDNVWMPLGQRSRHAGDRLVHRKLPGQHTLDVGRQATVKAAANLVMGIAYGNKDMLSAGMIVAGWDKYDGASVWAIPMGGSLLMVPYAIGGSGSAYITGYVDHYYKAGMSRDECLAFVRGAVAHAMSRDGSSGGICRTVVIDSSGVTREFVSESKGTLPETFGDLSREGRGIEAAAAKAQASGAAEAMAT